MHPSRLPASTPETNSVNIRFRSTVHCLQSFVNSDRSIGPPNRYPQTRTKGALATVPTRREIKAQTSACDESEQVVLSEAGDLSNEPIIDP